VRRTYGVPEDALVFLFLGRLHPAKGILRMVDAFAEFSRSCSRETRLLIVGRDDGFQAQTEEYILRNRLQDEVRIVNNVYDGRFDYYFLADVFLGFPTIFEETMLASIEAMACGTPILVSREADIPFVEKEHAGMVIEFGVRRAAEALAVLTQDLTSFQRNARRVATQHFMGSGIARKLGLLFQNAISSSVPPEGLCELEESTPTWAEDDSCIERAAAVASQK
jgi:glycosyltransferase involved in cell wall biosynthesis